MVFESAMYIKYLVSLFQADTYTRYNKDEYNFWNVTYKKNKSTKLGVWMIVMIVELQLILLLLGVVSPFIFFKCIHTITIISDCTYEMIESNDKVSRLSLYDNFSSLSVATITFIKR